MSDDPRMQMTLRDVERYLIIPRHRALVLWRFPVLYPDWKVAQLGPGAPPQCSPSD